MKLTAKMKKGDLVPFGQHHWRVLAIKDNNALLITDHIIELRWYHTHFVDVTWADCELRKYLNDVFYHAFTPCEQAKITLVANQNADSPWFRTIGGATTTDRIFLLSLEEVCEFFGDSNSTARLRTKGRQTWLIDDGNNPARQATYGAAFHWWRLRSPGYYGRTAASVNAAGQVYVRGNGVYGRPRDGGGVRPALWLKLEN